MAEVDDKVVSIKFDNASFEKKMSETISSLNKLRESLDLAGAKKGLTDVSAAAKGFDMSPMAVSVEGISAKFLALSTVAITALSSIVSKAASSGAAMLNSFSLGPITAGFSEYELKMGSIQTILSNTAKAGTTLDEVTGALDKLNTYADKTIYNFGDMTKNIGLFTNAGIGIHDATAMIKGFSNEAASSGTNAEGAASAAYQLSQALSTGTIRLMDWKSLSNVGMGNKNMQNGLIEIADAMGTLNKNGTNASEVQENFNASLEKNWLSADVMSSYLKIMAGEMDAAAMAGMGLSESQITAFQAQQKMSEDAATKVRTFTQLIGTVKESIGSGWSETFSHIMGNFEGATELFTNINNVIGDFVGKSSAARNELFGVWALFGGRADVITGLSNVFRVLGEILKPIGQAFRDIFPKKTAEDLLKFSASFREWSEGLSVTEGTAKKIGDAFRGFFAILSIGWEIIKGVTRVIFALAGGLWRIFSPLLNLVSGTGNLITGLHEATVQGEGISKFFDGFIGLLDGVVDALVGVVSGVVEFVAGLGLVQKAAELVATPIELLQKAGNAIKDFFQSISFGGSDGSKKLEDTGESMNKTAGLAEKFLDALKNVFSQIGEFLSGIGQNIASAFGGLGDAIAGALGSGDFSNVLNIIKTGLLGGILTMLVKFFRNGIKFDFGQGAIMDKLAGILDTVTSSLKSLQANVRADTLLKIAGAMGILAIAIVALSLINPEDLAKAMAAIAVGFAQMTTVMLAMEKMSGPGGSMKIMALATGMIAVAAAMALLVIPIKILGDMDMNELGKGLLGITVGLGMLSVAAVAIGKTAGPGMVRAGLSLMLVAGALIVLAYAIKKFAEMNLVDMAWGLAQAAIGIGLLILALKGMPDDVAKKGLGLLILAFALRSLAKVVELFASISFGVLAKGFISIAVGLALIGLSMDGLLDDSIKKAAGLVILAGALYLIGKVIEQVGSLPWDTLIKGVLSLNYMLASIAIALQAMEGSERGALALIGASVGLMILGKTIEQVGGLDFGTLLTGILGIAAVLAVLAVASLAAPGILLLGVGLMAIGAGFLFIGVGAAAAGKGLELAAKYGKEGMGHLIEALQEVIRQMPQFVSAFVEGLIDAFIGIGERLPELITTVENIFVAILEAIRNVIPEIGETITAFIDEALRVFTEAIPGFVEAGFALLVGWLTGIRDNIGEITTLVAEIISGFLVAVTEAVPGLVRDLTNLIVTTLNEVAFAIGKLVPTLLFGIGQNIMAGLITGVMDQVEAVGKLFNDIVDRIVNWVKSALGINSPSTVFLGIGKDIIQGLIDGVNAVIRGVSDFFTTIGGKIVGWVGDAARFLVQKGSQIISGLLSGINSGMMTIWNWAIGLGGQVVGWLGDTAGLLVESGKDLIRGLWNGIKNMKDWLVDNIGDLAGNVVDSVKGFFGIGSPSKVFMEIGGFLGEGLGIGLSKMGAYVAKRAESLGDNVMKGFERANTELVARIGDMQELNPTITPVLDLSKIQAGAKSIDGLMRANSISADVSLQNARLISATASARKDEETTAPQEAAPITFNQNNYSPTALSVNDIYRNTKSQIALAKEELNI